MVKKRDLTDQEKELWNQAMDDVKKLDKTVHKTLKRQTPKSDFKETPSLEKITEKIENIKELQPVDRTFLKKIKQGKIQIEARLDLHGMTQDQAYTALQKFIPSCHENGKKLVIVITGKGGMNLGEDDRPKGILKQNVPKWLRMFPEVLSISEALRQDGGSGAVYVILRRQK